MGRPEKMSKDCKRRSLCAHLLELEFLHCGGRVFIHRKRGNLSHAGCFAFVDLLFLLFLQRGCRALGSPVLCANRPEVVQAALV